MNNYKFNPINMTPFKWFCLENFPFIEEDFDSLTSYSLWCKLKKYFDDVANKTNEMGTQVENLTNAFNLLKDYIDNYFENLDVQEEINNKLDEMVLDGTLLSLIEKYLTPKLEAQNQKLNEFDIRLSQAENGSPLIANSISEMINTNRLYVNLTDGYVYYYNENQWIKGWIYQSTGLAENSVATENLQNNSVTIEKTNFQKSRTRQLFNKNNFKYLNKIWNENTGIFNDSANSVTIYIECKPNTSYSIEKKLGSRMAICTTNVLPTDENAIAFNRIGNNSPTTQTRMKLTTDESSKYLCLFCYNSSADVGVTLKSILDSIMICTGNIYLDYEDYYELSANGEYIKENTITKSKMNFDVIDMDFILKQQINILDYIKTKPFRGYSYNTETGEILFSQNENYKTFILPIFKNGKIRISKNFNFDTAVQMFFLDENLLALKNYNLTNIKNYSDNFPIIINIEDYKFRIYETYIEFICDEIYKVNNTRFLWFTLPTNSYKNNYVYYINTSNPNYLNAQEPLISSVNMFKNIAALGDSFTEGSVVNSSGEWINYPNISYIATLGKRAGVDFYNYGKGGSTTKSYLTTPQWNSVLNDDPRSFYMLAFGINDANNLDLGSINDINDSNYNSNADTFFGNYGKIIQQLLNHAPNSKIVLIKIMREGSQYTEFSNAIDEIAEHYSLPVINPYDDSFFNSDFYRNYQSSNHPTHMGYAGMGLAFERLISKCIVENADYFKFSNEI